jgi:broad specificity phosphatase PhoE
MRHGEPVGGRRFRGDGVDDPLSDRGWRQMWDTVGERGSWQHIVSSPMRRCHEFASALAGRRSLPLTVDARFREVGLGSWEGFSPAQLLASRRAEYESFYADPQRNRPQDAESLEDFGRRVADALVDAFEAHAGRHILVVAHAGVIRAALGYVLRAEPVAWYRTRVDNASFTRFLAGEYGLKLEFHNRLIPPE